MYKVNISTLEGLIKNLNANNKVLASFKSKPSITSLDAKIDKIIKENNKQIVIIKDTAPILSND